MSSPPILFNPFAPDLLADEVVRFEIVNESVRISLASARTCGDAEPAGVQLVIIGRLVLSKAAARALAINLYNFVEQQDRAGRQHQDGDIAAAASRAH